MYICYNLLHMKKDKLDGDVTLWLQHFALQPSPIAATVVDPRVCECVYAMYAWK